MVFKMIFNGSSRIFSLRMDRLGRNVHSFARIAEAHSAEAVGKRTKIKGWVKALRNMKDTIFLDVSDGSCNDRLQVVVRKSKKPSNLSYGSSVCVEGDLVQGPNGRVELHASDVSVFGECIVTDGYPFAPRKSYSTDYIRQFLHLRPRTNKFASLLRLRDLASTAVGDHFRGRGFIGIHTPILTSNDCEGAGEVFLVRPDSEEILERMKKEGVPRDQSYFDTKVFLTVSGQLHLETVARGLTRVFSFGPTFRAENSKSRLHLSEFYMAEAEVAFATSLEEIAKEAELLVKATAKALIDRGHADMHAIGATEPGWLNENFGFVSYDEAFSILENHVNQLTVLPKYGEAFSKEHELFLVQHNGEIPMFVVDWPKEDKPFYMKECSQDTKKVAAMDLLAPYVGELVGGSLREDDYDKLKSKLPTHSANLAWYLELRKYGNVPSGGFGMGFERFLQCVLGIPNIKDTIPFPRWPHSCDL